MSNCLSVSTDTTNIRVLRTPGENDPGFACYRHTGPTDPGKDQKQGSKSRTVYYCDIFRCLSFSYSVA
jgi:hypothetical protein